MTAMPGLNFRLFALPVLCAGIWVSALSCTPPPHESGEVVRSIDYEFAPYRLTKEVSYSYSSLGDDYYQWRYVLAEGEEDLTNFVGPEMMVPPDTSLSYSPPKQVDDWLAVFLLDRVWLWQEGQNSIAFNPGSFPDEDNVWQDAGVEMPSNWHHYAAIDFTIEDGKWILEYEN
ncbi:MAG: hypothetical protein AAFU53_12510, partial [Cyanobacteria bacterium J06632_3]